MAMKIGITGGIGSGKSFVCKLLAERGIVVYDCDDAAKRLMRTSPTLRCQLTKLIGLDTYVHSEDDVWTLNKAVVARFLLASATNAKALDAIVHPAVFTDFEQSGLNWMESAILYESGLDRMVDRVVVVTAPLEVRLQRIMERDHLSREKSMEWVARQLPQEEVRRRADFEIVNDGEADLRQQIENILITLSRHHVITQ
jgi:dephospho-CoA kinase